MLYFLLIHLSINILLRTFNFDIITIIKLFALTYTITRLVIVEIFIIVIIIIVVIINFKIFCWFINLINFFCYFYNDFVQLTFTYCYFIVLQC